MANQYKIRGGFSFVDHDGKTKVGGEVIELADDIAEQHLHKLEKLPKAAAAPQAEPAVPAEIELHAEPEVSAETEAQQPEAAASGESEPQDDQGAEAQ